MNFDKNKYQQLVENTILFSLNQETEYTAYKREFYRLIENLYCYLLAVNPRDYEPYGCEILEVATRCIKNYDSTKGNFLHYFNAAWKQEYSHILGDRMQEEKLHGLKLTVEEKRSIRKYLRLAEKIESRCSKEELYSHISEAMDISVEKVQLIAQMSVMRVIGDTNYSDDGEEISIWEEISDGTSLEKELEEAESVEDLFQKVESSFEHLGKNQKPIISDMITIRICSMLNADHRNKYKFVSGPILEQWIETGKVPTQRDIAAKYGRNEASISRTMKEYLKKLRLVFNEGA